MLLSIETRKENKCRGKTELLQMYQSGANSNLLMILVNRRVQPQLVYLKARATLESVAELIFTKPSTGELLVVIQN